MGRRAGPGGVMFLRVVALVGGLIGATGLSQFPEYSQQYTQRLAGAVDELSRFVQEFDADAAALELSRQDALSELADGSAMSKARARSMARTLERYERLKDALATLRGAGPFTRAYRAGYMTDRETAQAAWQDFQPAMPLGFTGLTFGAMGFLLGLGLVSVGIVMLRLPFRRRRLASRGR